MTSDTVIRAEGLGKKYIIGHQTADRSTTFRDVITQNVKNFVRGAKDMAQGKAIVAGDELEEFWALKDVNFEIKRGDVVGIIGRNGAGKSTLLKVLSRITEPTEGRVEIKGRVASLLEVGTGFHPELSGRENVYLNGAILGMTRAEINRKFDEIVDFSGVEKFLDTPVKRYSSGMYVRLAFAVAAHLEPEILVVDEVLAVGDAEFQKKCLGKMQDVAGQGRTVLFVSHNMAAVQAMCKSGILMESGRVAHVGNTESALQAYFRRTQSSATQIFWDERDRLGDQTILLNYFGIQEHLSGQPLRSGMEIVVDFKFECLEIDPDIKVGFELFAADGQPIFISHSTDQDEARWPGVKLGVNHFRAKIQANLLNEGMYSIAPRISVHGKKWIVNTDDRIFFDVILSHGVSRFWTSQSFGIAPGLLAPILDWQAVSDTQASLSDGEVNGSD